MYSRKEAQLTLNPTYMTAYHQQAQWAELFRLKETIGETFAVRNDKLRILDIGIGFGRIPRLLSCVDTWRKVQKYIGIEASKYCVAVSRRVMKSRGITDKVEVILFDATRLDKLPVKTDIEKYDLAVCTYFTAGDFKPEGINLQTKKDGTIVDYDISVLNPNKSFVAVFSEAHRLLKDGGKIFVGSVYCDNDFARRIQEDFYRQCGMTVITTSRDPFTATKEGFWSQRFNKKQIYDYFSWVQRDAVKILPLDDYDFAATITVEK